MLENKHYNGIEWLRVFACVGIVMMHVQANCNYHLTGVVAEYLIPSFTDFTFVLWQYLHLVCAMVIIQK